MSAARVNRRALICIAPILLASRAWAAPPAGGRLRFEVFRNGRRIGEHAMTFTRSSPGLLVVTEVSMVVRVGPVTLLRYAHQAREEWREGRFLALHSSTSTNGKRETVTARRLDDAVNIETCSGRLTAQSDASPLTHWNADVLGGPLFNPQTGRVLKVVASRFPNESLPSAVGPAPGTLWSLRGEAEIDNWYDRAGVWSALRGRLPDKSVMEYRKV